MESLASSLDLPLRCKSSATGIVNAVLDPSPMSARLNSIIRRREPGTNLRQLEDEPIAAWINGREYQKRDITDQKQPSSLIKKLFLYGFHGCGRTTLTASIIEHLIQTECTEKVGVCYYFCSGLDQETTDPRKIVRTLIAQLTLQSERAFEVFNSYLGNRQVASENKGYESFSLEDLGTLLGSVIHCFEHTFVVINSIEALLPGNASHLLSLLTSFTDISGVNVSILATGAEQPGLQELSCSFQFCASYVYGRSEDIRLYARAELKRRIERDGGMLEQSHLNTTIENYVTESSNGAWLWAICEIDNQCDMALQGVWEQPTVSTPPDPSAHPYWNYGPDQTDRATTLFPYRFYLDQVSTRGGPRERFILLRLLRWIYVGMMLPGLRISIPEVCDFLSILLLYHNVEDTVSNATVHEEEIIIIGGQFVRKSPDKSTLEFSHVTVEGYLMHHLDHSKREFTLQGQVDSDVIDEFDLVISQLESVGRLADAEAMMLRLIPCREQLWGPTGNPVLAAFNNLGRFYEEHDRIEEAEDLYCRALKGYETAKSPNKEAMFNTINNLAILYKRRGMFREAEGLYKRALNGREEILGPLSKDALSSMHCLGLLYATEGRLGDAAPLWEKYLHGLEETQGSDDSQTILATHDLGVLYKNDGRVEEAIPLLERALSAYERTNGQTSRATLDALDNLATAHAMKGQYEAAETLWKRLLDSQNESSGFDLNRIRTKENLGQLYRRQDRLHEAADMYKLALHDYNFHYGPVHVATGEMCSTLAELYEDLNILDLAEDMQLQAFHIFQRTLGPEDIATAIIAEQIGLSYAKQERIDEAASFWEVALRGLEKVNGEDHRSVLGQMGNLARVYKMQFRLPEAEAMLEKGFERSIRALGPQDSLTQRMGQDLVLLYENQEQLEKAERVSSLLKQ